MSLPGPHPTSIRLTADELELLDAYAAWMHDRHGINVNRTGAIKSMIKRLKPPDDPTPAGARFRRAHSAVFGRNQP